MWPYLKNTGIFNCPSNRSDNSSAQANSRTFSYGYNANLVATQYLSFSDCTVVKSTPNIPLSQIQNPASMIVFGDDTWGGRTLYRPAQGRTTWAQNFTNPPQAATLVDKKTNSNGNFPFGRHQDGVIMAFADGHVKWIQPEVIYNNGNDVPYYKSW